MNTAHWSEFGESITYTPADAVIDPFSCSVIFEEVNADTQHATQDFVDSCMAYLRHADYTTAGMAGPQRYEGTTPGDLITRNSLAGVSEDWLVVDADYDNAGVWALQLIRDIKVATRQ